MASEQWEEERQVIVARIAEMGITLLEDGLGLMTNQDFKSGEALVSEMRFGWGYNVVTNDRGIIGAYENPLNGQCVKGKVMVYPTVSGTTLGSVGLYYKCQVSKVGPSAIVCRNVHDIDIAGSIAGEIPAVDSLDGDPIQEIRTGDWVEIRADEVGKEATVTITRRAAA